MGLLDSFMPGENDGRPDQFGGLLNDPMFQVGLGILANNNSRDFGQVVGRGAMQGFQNAAQQQQYEQQRKMQDLQGKRFERQDKQFEAEEAAHAEFDAKFPQHKGLSRISPAAAVKLANPELAGAGADPYYQFLPTAGGYAAGNARTGKVEMVYDANGNPLVRATDSPKLQGEIEREKSRADGDFKLDTSTPGVTRTVTQSAVLANPTLQPQTAPTGQPSLTVPPNVQKSRDDVRLQILLEEQRNDGGPGKNQELDKEISRMTGGRPVGGGFVVPTPAELAADKARAEAGVTLETDKTKNVKKADQFLSVANQAKMLLEDAKNAPTASGLGAAADTVGSVFGYATDGSVPAAKLETLSGWMVANVPRMEGPQSNFDVQNYATMAGLVGDRTKPIEVRKGALAEVIKLQEKYKALNQEGSMMPKDEKMPQVNVTKLPAKPSALTLKKGVVYETPKGNLRWNGTAFED
jgi:hypothetical protein